MITNGFLVRRVMLSNFLACYRHASLTFLRRSLRMLPASNKLNASVGFQGWRSVACCRSLQTTFSAHRETRASAVEADTEAGGSRKTGIKLEELTQRLDSGALQLIDVREPNEIEETGSIPTSINIPLTELKSALLMSEVEFVDKFDSRKPRKDDTDIVFYGLSAVKSAAAVEIAQKLGFQGVHRYDGGWEEWSLNCRNLR